MKKRENNFMGNYDIFAVQFNFKYKRMDKYSTGLSHIFCLLYISFSLFFISFNFVFFITKSNFDLKIHSLVDKSDNRRFYMKSKLDFAYRLDCGLYNSIKPLEDLLQVNITVSYNRIIDDYESGHSNILMGSNNFNTFNCTYNSDYKQFQKVNTIYNSNYKCLDLSELSLDKNYYIENYSMIVSLKDSSVKNFYDINNYLLNNDCKIELTFIDYSILINEYSDPIRRFRNSLFLTLNPNSISQMDIYFMNQKLEDHNNFFIKSIKKTRENITFSFFEKDSNYKGEYNSRLNRAKTDKDYKTYAKIFIKTDTRTSFLIRQYQTLWEFIGELSSVLIAIYTLLDFIIGFYNQFNLYHFMTKKIFFFKDVKDEHLNYFPNDHKIINLINKMKDINNDTNSNNNNDNNISFYENFIKTNIKNSMILNQKESIEQKKAEIGEDSNINFNIPQDTEKNISRKEEKPKEIEFSFNIFEIFFNKCLSRCCISKNLELKKQIASKAMDILFDKLDIVLYIRNTMLLDLMKKILLGYDKESIIKFLSRPILSLKENYNLQNPDLSGKQNEKNNNITEKQKEKINENYCDTDFKNCEKEVDNLVNNKKEISEVDRKLILCTKQQLIHLYGD